MIARLAQLVEHAAVLADLRVLMKLLYEFKTNW